MTDRLSVLGMRDWLSGNTAVGACAGTLYQQFFRTDGATACKAEGAALTEGHWWVIKNEYCSWWQGLGEACYEINRDGDEWIWHTEDIFKNSYTAEIAPADELQVR
jgi:hypothetical protein